VEEDLARVAARVEAALAASTIAPPASSEAPLAAVEEAMLLDAARVRFQVTSQIDSRRALLDLVLAWPTPAMVAVLLARTPDAWAQERASLVLTLRFGRIGARDWAAWVAWLRAQSAALERDRPRLAPRATAAERLLLWELQREGDDSLVGPLEAWCRRRPTGVRPQSVVERWRDVLSVAEAN